jgi:hypothetical protein
MKMIILGEEAVRVDHIHYLKVDNVAHKYGVRIVFVDKTSRVAPKLYNSREAAILALPKVASRLGIEVDHLDDPV